MTLRRAVSPGPRWLLENPPAFGVHFTTTMDQESSSPPGRYDRQTAFEGLRREGQRRLAGGRAMIVGVGGLGCTVAQWLARAGVGLLRLVDDDVVSLENLHRQILFDEADAAARRPKVVAAARRLGRINSDVRIEPVAARFDASTASGLIDGIDVICDGTDNFAARFVINDVAVSGNLPWVFAGVVGAEAQTMTIRAGGRPCLRCVFGEPPPAPVNPTCRTAGVLGPAVGAIASVEALEALKILAGRGGEGSAYLVKLDLWTNTVRRIDTVAACADVDCPCCVGRHFEFLDGDAQPVDGLQ